MPNNNENVRSVSDIFDCNLLKAAREKGEREICIALGELEYISSQGVREMLIWLKQARDTYSEIAVSFSDVPPTVYRNLLTVKWLLPDKLKVTSTFIPFFCEVCADYVMHFVAGDAVRKAAPNFESALKPFPQCPKCKKEMELDVSREDYYSLLMR